MSHESNSPPPANSSWIAITVSALLAMGVLVWYLASTPAPFDNTLGSARPSVTLPPEKRERLFELRNRVVGMIDNSLSTGQLNDALGMLEEIEKDLPGDQFVTQNRAVIYCLSLQVQDKPNNPKVDAKQVFEILETIQETAPKSAVPAKLAADVAIKNSLTESLVKYARIATKLAPDDPVAWHFFSKAAEFATEEEGDEIKQESNSALRKASELMPRNVYVKRLLAQALVEAKDPSAAELLAEIQNERVLMELLSREQRSRDIPNQLGAAIQAIKNEDWERAQYLTQVIGNVMRQSDWVKADLQAIAPEQLALNLITRDFGADVISTEKKPSPAAPIDKAVFAESQRIKSLTGLKNVKVVELADINDDGGLDLVVLTAEQLLVHRLDGDHWVEFLAFPLSGEYDNVLIADLDGDENNNPKPPIRSDGQPEPSSPRQCDTADADIILTGAAGVLVLRNDLKPESSERELKVIDQADAFNSLKNVRATSLVDIDHDGDLDFIVSANSSLSIWRNVGLSGGKMVFEDVTSRSEAPPRGAVVTALTPGPWNLDCFVDVIASLESGGLAVLENLGHSTFRWRELNSPKSTISRASNVKLIDAGGDVAWDLALVGKEGFAITQGRATDVGNVELVSSRAALDVKGDWFLMGDFNNDTWMDALVWSRSGSPLQVVYSGDPRTNLTVDSLNLSGGKPISGLMASLGDIDHDGDMDFVVADDTGVRVIENQLQSTNHWLDLRVRAQPEDKVARVNHLAIGSIVEIWSGSTVRRQIIDRQFTHFGLGAIAQPELLRVVWTNCVPQAVLNPKTDQVVCEVQIQTTSCPFLFTWNGENHEFLCDFLWGAPLGLQFAEGVIAPSRPWEYLHIPGERMVPRDGKLQLQMTEELQEATYIDFVELLAIDHPAEFEVFSNEKVGPPDLAAFQIHTVKTRRAPIAARDKTGRNVLDEILLADRKFMKGFANRARSGRVDPHYLELDLGDLGPLDPNREIKLVLSGYIYPAPTSVAVGISQDPQNPPGSPPALWVPNESGEFQEVRPYAGFPGGKNKTIVLDLKGLFLARDYRIRIATNFEILWDEAFFTVDEQPEKVEITRVAMTRADLHYRGFSERRTSGNNGPDTYLYDHVDRSTVWLPMEGLFTRYGDIAPLLSSIDDEMVVFGFGDEITLEFENLSPPPVGWKRDYILHTVGWDKDSDPNVIRGNMVDPMPFQKMTSYPYGATEGPPTTESYKKYLKTYQTRRQNRLAFWNRQ